MISTILLVAGLLLAPQEAHQEPSAIEAMGAAQEVVHGEDDHAAAGHGEDAHHGEDDHGEFDIIHHIEDARYIELPFGGELTLPAEGSWMVGPIDMTPTKHVVFLWLSAILTILVFLVAARRAKKTPGGEPKGRAHNSMEAAILYFRDEVVMPNLGHGGEKFAPFVITLFFFILFANLLGLIPYGSTATGNVSVTAALALMTFVVVEVAGFRALGPKGYMGTIVYIPKGLPKPMIPIIAAILTPVELLGKLTKPFALAIRLFANMMAGHVLILAIIGLVFLFGSYAIAVGPIVMATALMFLEIFVAFLQAYIFALLTAVFIGLIRHAH